MHIIATGIAPLTHHITSASLDQKLKLPAGTVAKLSGVRSRQFATNTDLQSELAACAIRNAANSSGIQLESIDLVIAACGLPEQALPNTACAVLRQLGLRGIASFDVNCSCLSFMAALNLAASLLTAKSYRRIAVVSCDLASRGVDWDEPEASYIFGDGAAATLLEAGAGSVESFVLESYPEGFAHCQIKAGGSRLAKQVLQPKDSLFQMDGKAVFKLAAKTLPGVVTKALEQAHSSLSHISTFIPHQASHLGLSHMITRLGLPVERVVNIYAEHGNQVASSIPTALHYAREQGRLALGSRVMLLGTAAGFSAGAMVIKL